MLCVLQLLFLAVVSGNKRSLVVMVDNREIGSKELYLTYSIALNFNYAKFHDYDFMLVKLDSKTLFDRVSVKYHLTEADATIQGGDQSAMPWATKDKQAATTFHPILKQFRATPWAKLPALWNLTVSGWKGVHYDHIFYVDSDLVFNPAHRAKSISQAIVAWSIPGSVYSGETSIMKSTMLFFSNAPWIELPCAGAFILNPKQPRTKDLLLQWWDFNISSKNFMHEFEQAALWEMYKEKHPIYSETTYFHNEVQFPLSGCDQLWLCHLGYPWAADRLRLMRGMFYDVLKLQDHDLEAIIAELKEKHIFVIDSLDLTEAMTPVIVTV